MDFRITETFTDSLERLTGDEQKTVESTAFIAPIAKPLEALGQGDGAMPLNTVFDEPYTCRRRLDAARSDMRSGRRQRGHRIAFQTPVDQGDGAVALLR